MHFAVQSGKSVRFKVMIDDLAARFPATGKEMIAEIVSEYVLERLVLNVCVALLKFTFT